MATGVEHDVAGAVGGDRGMRDTILDAALSFICSTDKDLEMCDRDGDGTKKLKKGGIYYQKHRKRKPQVLFSE